MISAVILTKNEEKNINDCLDSLSWCDEKIVIDDMSEDKTVELAEKSGVRVFVHKLTNFSDQRNYGLDKARGDWILFLDADERVSSALCFEMIQQINEPLSNVAGFSFKRIDIIWGRQLMHGETGHMSLLRLARKNAGKWTGAVHEKWNIKGKTMLLKNPLYHYPHQSVKDFMREINRYTDLRAEELFKMNKKANWPTIILYPKAKFFLNYFIRLGFLDGMPGLVTALMMSFHSFLVRGKLWLLWDRKINK